MYLDSSDSILCWGFVVESSDPVCFQRSCGRIRLGCHSPNHAHHWQFLAFPLKGRNNLVHGARKLFVFLDINCESHWIQEHLYLRFSDSSYLRSIRIIRVARALRGVRVIRLIHYIGALRTLVHLCRIRKYLCVCVIALCSDNLRNLRDWLCLMLQV